MNYDEAHAALFIDKKIKKGDQEKLKKKYPDGKIPCNGLVVTKEDAFNAIIYYLLFYQKLVSQDRVTDKTKSCFQKTINKCLKIVWE